MELTLKELNQIYYGLHVAITHQSEHKLLDVNEINEIIDKVLDEIDLKIYETDNNEVENNDGWEDEDGDY